MQRKNSLILHEHENYVPEQDFNVIEYLEEHNVVLQGVPDEYMGTPKYLALDSELNASYFVGASWLVENELSLVVLPKIKNVDFLEMFMSALSVEYKEENYFSKCYGIDFNAPPIETNEDLTQLTPLLLVHYIMLLEKLTKQGLKRDYITVTENLKNKIKGHIVFSQQIKRNIITHRFERNVCTYQVYTYDIPVNRLLKRALIFANNMLVKLMPSNIHTVKLKSRINKIMSYFYDVSDNIQISEVKHCYGNKLFKNYTQAISVAKDILRRYDYSLSNIDTENKFTPCFWIDMSRLFELYVFAKLSETYGSNIKFQVPGYQKTAADYIHVGEHIIIDAKYKPRYDISYRGILTDIREISGYSRDYKILKYFGKDFINSNEEVKCLIIYPQNAFKDDIDLETDDFLKEELIEMEKMNEFHTGQSLWDQGINIKYFRNFRKLKISLPMLNGQL